MRLKCEECEICHQRDGVLFAVVSQNNGDGLLRVDKAHVCLDCFEGLRQTGLVVEEVSQQEFKAQQVGVFPISDFRF